MKKDWIKTKVPTQFSVELCSPTIRTGNIFDFHCHERTPGPSNPNSIPSSFQHQLGIYTKQNLASGCSKLSHKVIVLEEKETNLWGSFLVILYCCFPATPWKKTGFKKPVQISFCARHHILFGIYISDSLPSADVYKVHISQFCKLDILTSTQTTLFQAQFFLKSMLCCSFLVP